MRRPALLLMLALAQPLAAQPLAAAEPGRPLTAAEFEAATVGRTLYYTSDGAAYGAEQYLAGRRVIWAFLGDDCRRGEWYEADNHICFVYEDTPEPQCWTFYPAPEGLTARFRGDPDGTPLVAVEESPEPMECLGPNPGV